MRTSQQHSIAIRCRTEYGILRDVLVCEPVHIEIKDVINRTQKAYRNENINQEKAIEQHQAFTDSLQKNHVNVHHLTPVAALPEQTFTRDIGFVIDEQLFLGDMAAPIRQGEEQELTNWLDTHQVPFTFLSNAPIEGGDVVIDRHRAFVGISSRTSQHSFRALQRKLPDIKTIPVTFHPKYLHLDCVFNIISQRDALVFPDAFPPESLKRLSQFYHLIPISAQEQFTLGTNVLNIGNKRIVSQIQNSETNELLRRNGFEVIELDFTEIIKSGGAFRCCTFPLVRD